MFLRYDFLLLGIIFLVIGSCRKNRDMFRECVYIKQDVKLL